MWRGEHEVFLRIHQVGFALGELAPKQEHDMRLPVGDGSDNGIAEQLPSDFLMTGRLGSPYGKDGIDQEHPLSGPGKQVAALSCRYAKVGFYFLEDIHQRRGWLHAIGNAEAQPVRLPAAVVRILPEDDHFHIGQWSGVEGVEDESAGRVNGLPRFALLQQMRLDVGKVR